MSSNSRQILKYIQLQNKKVGYLYYKPSEIKDKAPAICFLHGAGECGDNLNNVKKHGIPYRLEQSQINFPFVVVSPQLPMSEVSWTGQFGQVIIRQMVEILKSDENVDPNRMYLTGLSLGGFGTFGYAAYRPKDFAAYAPICGGIRPYKQNVEVLKDLPIWCFHAANDIIVPVKESDEIMKALQEAGATKIKYTRYAHCPPPRGVPENRGDGHDSWTETYENQELYDWFLQHTLSD